MPKGFGISRALFPQPTNVVVNGVARDPESVRDLERGLAFCDQLGDGASCARHEQMFPVDSGKWPGSVEDAAYEDGP